jgi:hypothetical protein
MSTAYENVKQSFLGRVSAEGYDPYFIDGFLKRAEDEYMAWQAGLGSIQDLMPYLSDNDREFILSGITPDEWDEMFADTDEEV